MSSGTASRPITAVVSRGLHRFGGVLAELATRHRVPVAQLAIHIDGETCAFAASGTGVPAEVDARIPIGSITKSFTAALVALLVADDDLSLADPIGSGIPELGTDTEVGRLTVRQLLSHTSGLPAGVSTDPGTSMRRYVRACRELSLVVPPGTGFSYSNIGYVLLGLAATQATGMDWAEAVDSLVLRPLKITPSFVVGADDGGPFLPGHAVSATAVRPVRQTLTEVEAPAGALALSATDLVVFGQALFERGDDEFALLRQQVAEADPFGLADGWGLGLALFSDPDGNWVGHDGTADGTSCHLRVDADHGVAVALATNGSSGVDLWEDVLGALRTAGVPVGNYDPGCQSAQPRAVPAEFAGRYANGDMEYVVLVRPGVPATLVVGGESYPELLLHAGDTFSVWQPATGRRVPGGRFLRDRRTGQVVGLQTGGRLAGRSSS